MAKERVEEAKQWRLRVNEARDVETPEVDGIIQKWKIVKEEAEREFAKLAINFEKDKEDLPRPGTSREERGVKIIEN